jgi:hypothetical protein
MALGIYTVWDEVEGSVMRLIHKYWKQNNEMVGMQPLKGLG